MIAIPEPGRVLAELSEGTIVLARYPDTTCFYQGTVMGTNLGACLIKFDSDSNRVLAVDRRFVLPLNESSIKLYSKIGKEHVQRNTEPSSVTQGPGPLHSRALRSRSGSPQTLQRSRSTHDPVVPVQSLTELSSKFTRPQCKSHNEPCIQKQSETSDRTKGGSFWICARPLGPNGETERGTQWRCKTFIWCSDWHPDKAREDQPVSRPEAITPQKGFICEHCDKSFSDVQSCNSHMRQECLRNQDFELSEYTSVLDGTGKETSLSDAVPPNNLPRMEQGERLSRAERVEQLRQMMDEEDDDDDRVPRPRNTRLLETEGENNLRQMGIWPPLHQQYSQERISRAEGEEKLRQMMDLDDQDAVATDNDIDRLSQLSDTGFDDIEGDPDHPSSFDPSLYDRSALKGNIACEHCGKQFSDTTSHDLHKTRTCPILFPPWKPRASTLGRIGALDEDRVSSPISYPNPNKAPPAPEISNERQRGRRQIYMKKKTVKDADGYLITTTEPVWESFSEDDEPASSVPQPPVFSSSEASNSRRQGRRQIMKKKTVKDADGYLITTTEPVWESFSEEDEPAPSVLGNQESRTKPVLEFDHETANIDHEDAHPSTLEHTRDGTMFSDQDATPGLFDALDYPTFPPGWLPLVDESKTEWSTEKHTDLVQSNASRTGPNSPGIEEPPDSTGVRTSNSTREILSLDEMRRSTDPPTDASVGPAAKEALEDPTKTPRKAQRATEKLQRKGSESNEGPKLRRGQRLSEQSARKSSEFVVEGKVRRKPQVSDTSWRKTYNPLDGERLSEMAQSTAKKR